MSYKKTKKRLFEIIEVGSDDDKQSHRVWSCK